MSNNFDLDWNVKTGEVNQEVASDYISKETIYKYVDLYEAGLISRQTLNEKLGITPPNRNYRIEGIEAKDLISSKNNSFWKIENQYHDEEGYLITLVTWPSNRMIFMKDKKNGKVMVPVWDDREVTNTKKELIGMLKKSVDGQNLKYIYVFQIEDYPHLMGMVALSEESDPVTDFFKDARRSLLKDVGPIFKEQ